MNNADRTLRIRHAHPQDLPRLMEIYAHARRFMAEHGNPRQWGATNWPPEALIREDIDAGRCHVCVNADGGILGTFCYFHGTDADATYRVIEDGSWTHDGDYGVVHRIAVAENARGIGSFCILWAAALSGCLRMDTHPDNTVMQRLLTRLGFRRCGVIHVEEDNDPRYAFELIME